MLKSRLTPALALGLAACVAPQRVAPPAVPRARPAPAPVAPQPADWRDRALTAGEWSYAARAARFGTALTLTCAAGQVRLTWAGTAPGPMTVRTTYGDVIRQAAPDIVLGARDPLLDQLAYSRGRFMLIGGGRELIAPVAPEVARVVEDCR